VGKRVQGKGLGEKFGKTTAEKNEEKLEKSWREKVGETSFTFSYLIKFSPLPSRFFPNKYWHKWNNIYP
jgi:hypothetical protein